jgi:hypothetical protein
MNLGVAASRQPQYPPFGRAENVRNLAFSKALVQSGRSLTLASYDRSLNGACVPVRQPGSEIPAESLVRLRKFKSLRSHPV